MWPVARIIRTHQVAMQLSALEHLQGLYTVAAGVAPAFCGTDGQRVYNQLVRQFLGIYRG